NLLNRLRLINVLAKFSTERYFISDRVGSLVPGVRFDVLLSIVLWNAQVVLVAPKDFERNSTRSIVRVDLRGDRQCLFKITISGDDEPRTRYHIFISYNK
ncbi:MAG: hypothetical protein ACO3JQ_04095, partial [Pelagibacteraceae bacterium]